MAATRDKAFVVAFADDQRPATHNFSRHLRSIHENRGPSAHASALIPEVPNIPLPAPCRMRHNVPQMIPAIADQSDFYRALVDSSQEIISILAADGTIRFESPAVERVLGFRPEELVGRNAFDLVHPEDGERVMQYFRQVLLGLTDGSGVQYRFRHKEGWYKYLEVCGTNALNDATISGILVSSRDVTGRVIAQAETRAAEERYHAVFEHTTDFIIILDLNGKIKELNPAALQAFGYSLDEALRLQWMDVVHEEDRGIVREMIGRKLAHEQASTLYSIRVLPKTGKPVRIQVNSQLLVLHGVPLGLQAIARIIADEGDRE